MKKMPGSLVIFALSVSFCFAQINTFGSFTKKTTQNYSVKAAADGGFVISGENAPNAVTKLIKVSANGTIEWRRTFAGEGPSAVTPTNDGGYLLSTTVTINDTAKILLYKTDSHGNLLWFSAIGDSADHFRVFRVIQTSDHGYVVSLYKNYYGYLIKTDSEGNFLWEATLLYAPSNIAQIAVIETNEGKLAVAAYKDFYIFNADGSIQLHVEGMGCIDVAQAGDGNYILMDLKKIKKVDAAGTLLWEKNYSVNSVPKSLAVTNNDDIIIVGKYLIRLNSTGDEIWHKELLNTMYSIAITSDEGYVGVGGYQTPVQLGIKPGSRYGDFIKYNTQARSRYLMFYDPPDSTMLIMTAEQTLHWLAGDSESVEIDVSADNGLSWQPLVRSLPSQDEEYAWQTPFDPGGIYSVKIITQAAPLVDDRIKGLKLFRRKMDYIAINQIKMWFGNDGMGSHNPITDGQGLFWPGGENAGKGAIFQDGLVWGGLLNGDTMVYGNTYREGLQPGNILPDGSAANPDSELFAVWKARSDWQNLPAGPERDRLEYDWNHWPAQLGAPYQDLNGNGRYDPDADNPVVAGDEVDWTIMNAADSGRAHFLYGADPIAVEQQVLIYGYHRSDGLGDIIFKRYKLINKSNQTIHSMYVSYWSDPDLGDAADDFVGCDTVLNLGYCYNGDNEDAVYGIPPAAGYTLLQGPLVQGAPNDSGFAFGQWHKGYRNKGLSAFVLFIGGTWIYADPQLGTHKGSIEMYFYMIGRKYDGGSFEDPITDKPTSFVLSGDPVTGNGWYEGAGWPGSPTAGDRRLVLSSGPFTFAPGDSQEVVFAIIMAQGADRLASVTKLKEKAKNVRRFYYSGVYSGMQKEPVGTLPLQFSLGQNYPNPFNPVTIINYSLAVGSPVELTVYNALGQKVKELVNEKQKAGIHSLHFKAYGLASGVYFYRLKAGRFVQTRKMLLIH